MSKEIFKFPKDFLWGAATSAYQIEGAHNIAGKGKSIWDEFCERPGAIADGSNGNVACDHYFRIEEDVALMKAMGLRAYRFSIAWTRLMPTGKKDTINKEGIAFYNRLFDCLLANGIEPWITLYHWDLPLELELTEKGWAGDKIVERFVDYADLCFGEFGDRVKNWITINEPWVVAVLGYGNGEFAPGISSQVKPYQVAHNLLLAHARAVEVYRNRYGPTQQGRIGITNNCDWREPLTSSAADRDAAQRALEFFLGWFADPVYFGEYPKVMHERVQDRLPLFTDEQKERLKGSSDFFGLNHYTTLYASECNGVTPALGAHGNGGLIEDQGVALTPDKAWATTDMQWAVVPWGCNKLLHWIKERYDNPEIYITENGCAYKETPQGQVLDDSRRVEYFKGYLSESSKAIARGVNMRGYFAWSLLDNFEWTRGYEQRFGLHSVDFKTGKRTPKQSAYWFKDVIANNAVNS